MKIEGYKPSVNLNTVNAQVRIPSEGMAYGTGIQGYASLAKGVGIVAGFVSKELENKDKQTILQAMDTYNKGRYNIMYNEKNGLMHTQAEGSAGISDSYVEQEKELRNNILSNIKLNKETNRVALMSLMDNSAREGYEVVDKYQYAQYEKVKDLTVSNNMQNFSEIIQKNWNNLDLINNTVNKASLTLSLAYGDRGAEYLVDKQRTEVGGLITNAVTAAITHEDYATSKTLIEKYGHYLTADQRGKLSGVVYNKEEGAFERSLAKELSEKYGDDEASVLKALDGTPAFDDSKSLEGNTWVRKDGVSLDGTQDKTRIGLSVISKDYKALAGEQLFVTSGTDGDHNSGSRSHGGGWKIDVASDWLAVKANRDKFIKDCQSKGIVVRDEYEKPSEKSTAGHLDLDFTDFVAPQQRSLSYEAKDRVLALYKQNRADAKRIERYNDDKAYEALSDNLFAMKAQGASYDEAMRFAEAQAGTDIKKLREYKSAVGLVFDRIGGRGGSVGSGGSGGSGSGTFGYNERELICEALSRGMYKTELEMMIDARNKGASDRDLHNLRSDYQDWLQGKGVFGYDFNAIADQFIPKTSIGDATKAQAKSQGVAAGKLFVRDYRMTHNGQDPTPGEVIEAVQKGAATMVSGTYVSGHTLFWDDNKTFKYSQNQLAAYGIRKVTPADDRGYSFTVVKSDGTTEWMSAKELDEYMGGAK